MNAREKELIAVAASVAAGCEYCTGFHAKAARENGATDEGLERMINTALMVRERATARMSSVAWGNLGREVPLPSCDCAEPLSAVDALASAACALAANCGSGVPLFLSAAEKAGAEESDIREIMGMARKIRKVSAEKADEAANGARNCSREGSCCSSASQSACC